MAVGDTLSIDDYQTAKREAAVVVPVDFKEPLPQPTADLATAKADLARAGYAILTGAILPVNSGFPGMVRRPSLQKSKKRRHPRV